MFEPIPFRPFPGKIPGYHILDEEMVEVLDSGKIEVRMQYPELGMEHAFSRCLLRKTAYERLLKAAEYLPDCMHFVIWDAWRPFSLQEELFHYYSRQMGPDRCLAGYVCKPVLSEGNEPVHTTGGAVDLTLADDNGELLPMGSDFDDFSTKSHLDWYELFPGHTKEKQNRRILYSAMTSAGFTPLPTEWWHYDYGDRFWSFYKGMPSMYQYTDVMQTVS